MNTKLVFSIMTLLLAIVSFAPSAWAADFHSCTREHLNEAIALNNERQPLYASLSDNESVAISKALIDMENDLLKMAIFSDIVSYPYQKAGVPIMCDEYVSMSLTPKFAEKSALPWPQMKDFELSILPTMIKKIKDPLANGDYAGVTIAANDWLKQLEKNPNFHCLERHFVESMGRAAAIAHRQNNLAKENLGIGSLWISKLFIKSHFDLMKKAQELDAKAAPLQAKGIAIICQDIPPIAIPVL